MNTNAIITIARHSLSDTVEPYLWTDWELLTYLDEAQREAAVRAQLLVDSISDFTLVTTTPNDPYIALDPSILTVRRAYVVDTGAVLDEVSASYLDDYAGRWVDSLADYPTLFMGELQTHQIRLFPIPNQEVDIRLTVTRLPLASVMDDPADTADLAANYDTTGPEIHEMYHDGLINWIRYRAYLRPDEDTRDPGRAAEALNRFSLQFGERLNARLLEAQRTLSHKRIRMQFF